MVPVHVDDPPAQRNHLGENAAHLELTGIGLNNVVPVRGRIFRHGCMLGDRSNRVALFPTSLKRLECSIVSVRAVAYGVSKLTLAVLDSVPGVQGLEKSLTE